ncbi:MAG TPA: hypothetical protein VNA17_04395 [Pyrinomonadaceae bacterium]|nr:hypothetical protein [Pyrinomonadaceae bacterium]
MKIRNFTLAMLLLSMLIGPTAAPIFAQPDAGAIKSQVERRLRENKAKVMIETRDGRKLKAEITSAQADSFTIVENKSTQPVSISYGDVTKLNGTGWGKGTKVGLGVGIGGGITALILFIAFQRAIRDN